MLITLCSLVCLFVCLFVLAPAWNVLVLGDQKIVGYFERFTRPRLAKIYKDKQVKVYSANNGPIKDTPYDAVILAVDLASLRIQANPFAEVLDGERKAVEHFGEAVYRLLFL